MNHINIRFQERIGLSHFVLFFFFKCSEGLERELFRRLNTENSEEKSDHSEEKEGEEGECGARKRKRRMTSEE